MARSRRGEGRLFLPKYRDRSGTVKESSVWWWAVSVNGVKQRLNTHLSDEKAARAWVRERLVEMDKGDHSSLSAAKVRLEDLERLVTGDYIANKRRALKLLPSRFRALKRLLGNPLASQITDEQLIRYRAKRLEEKAAPGTINMEFAFLRKGYRLARKLIPHPPEMPYLKLDNARKGFFERPAFELVLSHLPSELHGALRAAYITGWRLKSDLLTRQWRHVDFDAGWLRIEPGEGKTKAGRMFVLLPDLREVLEAQRAYTTAVELKTGSIVGWVFHRNGRPIKSLGRAWEAARKKAGLPEAIIHDFRRTAVRNLERAGIERSASMAMVGMKTESIWRRYAIVDETQLVAAGEKYQALLERQRAEAAKVTAMRGRKA